MTRIIETVVMVTGGLLFLNATTVAQSPQLPPPLEIPSLDEATRQQFPIVEPPPIREINIQSPPPLLQDRNVVPQQYRVEVLGNSPSLLSQVREIEPNAFIRSGEGIIQVGLFNDVANAQQRLRTLSDRGISGRMVSLGNAPVSNPLNLQSPPPNVSSSTTSGYFVVIPGREQDLQSLMSQTIQLGVQPENVTQRRSPRGPHVAVGPFGNSENAHRWSHYFRSEGLNARVFFQR